MSNTKYCNCCARPLDEWDLQQKFAIHTLVGYGSKYDTEKIRLQLCCSCFDNLVDKCAIPPVENS